MIVFAWILWSYLLFLFSLVLIDIFISRIQGEDTISMSFGIFEDLIFKIAVFVFLSMYIF